MNALRLRLTKTSACMFITAVGLSLVVGCGDDTGLDKRYPVSGTVKYKGQPVAKGQISFIATDKVKQRDANGFIQDGYYSLTTATPGDGALPGEYMVTIVSKEVKDPSVVTDTVKKFGGGGRQYEIVKAAAKAANLVPGKYQLTETSGLKQTVKEQSNTIDFD